MDNASEISRLLVVDDIAGWGVRDGGGYESVSKYVSFQRVNETEWHEMYFFTNEAPGHIEHRKIVVNLPSWEGAVLQNKIAASKHMFACDVGPPVFETSFKVRERVVLVSKWLDGGTLQRDDLSDPACMLELGKLYGRLHCSPHKWFDNSVKELRGEGLLQDDLDDNGSWASCLWILPWLLRQVPDKNRQCLQAAGVDWEYIEKELAALPLLPQLPKKGRLGRTVTVHGDSHIGNIMRNGPELRLIDFDMTARGPAGSELGFLTLMVFGCGFAPDLVLPRVLQRSFAEGYIEATSAHADSSASDEGPEELLLDMHLWTYIGLLKMGLLCAVLMANEGHERKREVMRERGPVLLHREFLEAAKETMQQVLDGDAKTREDLLCRGLFFVAHDKFERARARR